MGATANQVVSTTIWASVEKFGLMGIQFIISMVLARLLSPDDYGVIAMLLIFVTIAQVFIDSGFGSAIIRKLDCTNKDYSTAFYFNIFVGISSYIILFLLAPYIAKFYSMELLSPILRWYGLSLITNSMIIVQNSILTQRLAFKAMAKCSIVGNLISGVAALLLAYLGCGVWALVFQQVSLSFISLLLITCATKWRPILTFSRESFRYLWSFGSKSLLSSLISAVYGNIYSLVIGKFYTKADLGFFNRGQSIAGIMPNIVTSIFGKSTLPLLSKVQDDKVKLSELYRKFIILVAFISFPMVFAMFVLSKPFVLFFLSEKWAEAIPYIQIFSISALTGAIGMVNLNLLVALGRTDLTLKANVIKKSTGFVVVALLVSTSPMILSIGCMAMDLFIYVVNLYYAKKVIGLKYSSQLKDLMPFIISSIIMAVLTYLVVGLLPTNLLKLIIGAVTSIVAYFILTYFIFKTPLYQSIIEVVGQRFSRKS